VLASHTAVVTAAMPTAAVKDISRLSKEIKKLVVASFHDLETPLLRAMNATLRAATTVDEAAAFAKDAAAAQVAKLPPGSDPTTVYITYNLTFVIAQSIVAEKLGSDSVAAAMSARIDEAIGALEAARVLSIVGQVPSPITSVRPGKYPEALSVILSSPLSVPNLRIHFTTDGSTPTILSPKFSVPILIGSEGGEVLLRAIAVAPRLDPSEELSAQFIFPSKGLSVKSGLLMIGLPALGGLILVTLAAVFLIRRFVNKTKAGAWKIDPSLVTIERDKVLGSGTFGLVYAGKFRGSDVAVKEVFLHRRDYVAAMAAAGLTSLDSPGMTVTNTAMSPSSSNASLLMGPSSKVHPSGSQGRIESSPSKAAWVGQGSDDSEGTQGSRKNLISNKHSSLTSTMRGPGSTYLARTQMRGADASGYDDTKLSTKDLEGELSVLASLRHPNCLFLFGAFLNPKLSMVFVTERMEISLSDLLHTPTVQISAHRAVKLALDVARGMSYLHAHDPPILHRDLKSQNILVGSDNVAKVADFGLSELAGGRGKSIGTPPWTAPEVFENASSYAMASDVFSFGVVLWELATRRDPWWDEVSELPARQQRETIHAKVTAGARPSLGVVNKSLPKGFSGLIERCWAADPAQRPTMEECKTELAVILSACAPDDGEGGSASNQGLLKHMLTPEEVKSSLAAVKAGDPVPAIHLDTTCILFADVVGFTSFTDVVGHERSNALLAEAFGRFDPIFERHGMVQIDLLGDCVIAGAGLSSKHRLDGLTARSGDKSPFTALCPEVCRAALEMVGSTRDLMIDPDRPELGCLQWRIGIACGPLSASVVGNKNIKLQLIGDAVNTASRMESSGMAAKIQVTESVKASCAGNADLSFSFRGRIQVKGKGDMLTYFLDILQDQDRVATSPPRPAIVPSPEKAKLKK
jgi:serine/threonine protein kinase